MLDYVTAEDMANPRTSIHSAPNYPRAEIGQRLHLISQLIKNGCRASVYYATQAGHDTHVNQESAHGNLLHDFSDSLVAFLNDLRDSGLAERTVVMAFSIVREISGIGFQPVELKMTGWKPIPRKNTTVISRTMLSEFGRRVAENGTGGTDHGTAGLVFIAGSKIIPGLHGAMPSLDDLDAGDLKHSVDFRFLYTGLLEKWLGLPLPPFLEDFKASVPFI